MIQSITNDMVVIDCAWGKYTVPHEKVIAAVLDTYARGIEAIKERNYTDQDIRFVSCGQCSENARADAADGTRFVPFILSFHLLDGQHYRRILRLRMTSLDWME